MNNSLTEELLLHRTANTKDSAWMDISARGLLGCRHKKTFVDVQVFNPLAATHKHPPTSDCYRSQQNPNEQRVKEVEQASFNPLGAHCFSKRWINL